MKYIRNILWIAFFSLVGFVQFLLIVGGVLFFKEVHMSPPWVGSILRHGGAFFAFFSLVWPFYMVIAGKKTYRAVVEENRQLKEDIKKITEPEN